MMKLSAAASYFDRTQAVHPDTLAPLFKCQIDPYDDSKRDAGAAYRRVMSVKPGTAVPGAVRVFDRTWLVGTSEIDGLADPHRTKFVLQTATARASVARLAGFLAGTVALNSWIAAEWLKDTKELEVSSNVPQMFNIFAPAGTDIRVHDVVWYAGFSFLITATHPQPSGFTLATGLRLEQLLPLTATIAQRTYVPASGSYTAGASTTVNALRVRWQSLYIYGSQADARYQEGDSTIVVPTGTTVSTSTLITLDGVAYTVISVDEMTGARAVHARPR